jgi:pSer/pThr/pTyr-binding forkhead associated (FHA) protein
VRITVPHVAVITESDEVTKSSLNDMIHHALAASAVKPCALEVYDANAQRFLFAREKQIYAAAEMVGGQVTSTSIREFLIGTAHMDFPRAALLELNTKILHSTLVFVQKKPALRVMTNLVDLDELLDRIEAEGKSSIVAAARDSFLAILRYEKGKSAAFCHGKSSPTPREGTLRDEFLVKVYTQAAQQPLTVSLYEDFLVSHAPDAKHIPDSFQGRFEDLFLSKPPLVVLRFKDREIGRWEMDRPRLRIGRTPDNDIVIDNLAVSRLHAMIEEDKGSVFVRDCDSLNGTEVNGERITRAKLQDGDEIKIGKHTILFRVPFGHAIVPEAEATAGFDQTMVFSRSSGTPLSPTPPRPSAPRGPEAESHPEPTVAVAVRHPRLVVPGEFGTRVIEISDQAVTIGSDRNADVHVEGVFVAARHAEIVLADGRVLLRRVAGLRPVRVRGKAVREIELRDGDEIHIGNESFVYHE